MIIALNSNPDMLELIRSQIPDINIVTFGDYHCENEWMHLEKNEYWVGNWDKVLRDCHSKGIEYVAMLNDDIEGISKLMIQNLFENLIQEDAFMVTPAFNSPHSIFHAKGTGLRGVNWVDMTCPVIDVNKYIELGGFDLRFIGYGADVDLSYRARQTGYKMFVVDDFEIRHLGGKTVEHLGTWEQSDVGRMNEILMEKYGKAWSELI